MIRFRNPSSSLETMLASFEQLYSELKDKEYFDNDDIAVVLAKANLMASSGFTGDAALSLGANEDRSRDKTYNNAKMFAEIFRLLGLISIVNNVSSNYRFTFIGEHMVAPNVDKKALIEQCILGMNNPNRIIDVSYDESVRFFSCVLLTMSELDDCICRDEMILGPMCVNDNSKADFNAMIAYIKSLRGNYSKLQSDLEKMAKSLQGNKKGGMTVTSVQNCTRFPISVLKYCGWVESENMNLYKRSIRFMKLTQHGKDTVKKLRLLKDIRLEDYERSTQQQRQALIRLGTYQMLARAKFDLSPVVSTLEQDKSTCKSIIDDKEVLFSPYQTLEYHVVNSAMHIRIDHSTSANLAKKAVPRIQEYQKQLSIESSAQKVSINKNANFDNGYVTADVKKYVAHVQELHKKNKSIDQLVKVIVDEHIGDKKTEYYPFVETLFRIIGVDCHKSRDGVNGERWDAMIRDSKRSIPIEIKSPTEEMHISVKAIRQALENKIILLSRKTYITTEECSSYAVGYLAPNARAEVVDLISDIKTTFGYRIAVFDIESLIRVSVNIIIFGKGIDVQRLYELEGIVNVTDIES
ncbi:hypothetical protein ACTM9N_06455 [Lachnospiraceae bacterium HCP1S3_A8]